MDVIISGITLRTGSTLVQRIFNTRRGTLIWGEQGGIVSEFVRIRTLAAHFSIHGRPEKEAYFAKGENPNTWIANMSPEPERVAEGVVQALRVYHAVAYSEFRAGHDRIGFKEVRYGKPEIELLKTCYPKAKIVLLVRHPIPVWQSASTFWAGDAAKFANVWNERALHYAELYDPQRNIYLFRYEDIVLRDESTLNLLAGLAEVNRAEMDNVLNVKLNSTPADQPEEDLNLIRTVCLDGLEKLGYEA